MLTISLIFLFIAGYIGIALEHPLKINKTGTALLLGVGCWTVLSFAVGNDAQIVQRLSENLSEIAQILFYLLGAMTIVEIIDAHKGFALIARWVHTHNKVALLWLISLATFFLSAVLDNLTTSIVMVSLLRKMAFDKHDRLIFASSVILAANAGGAWTPIGDVTTTMLWISGRISSWNIIIQLILPSLICFAVPLTIQSFFLKGKLLSNGVNIEEKTITEPGGTLILFLGIASLIFVPIFKMLTHLQPFMGILLGVGVLWGATDLLHKGKKARAHLRMSSALSRIDISSVLFFMGILLAVGALQVSGILDALALLMDQLFPNKQTVIYLTGLLSAVVDNVPLVAAGIGMWNTSMYPMDSQIWAMLAYCAGTGGSILIIGSATGVVVMGMEKIDFFWYVRKVSAYALIGYTAGFLTYIFLVSRVFSG